MMSPVIWVMVMHLAGNTSVLVSPYGYATEGACVAARQTINEIAKTITGNSVLCQRITVGHNND